MGDHIGDPSAPAVRRSSAMPRPPTLVLVLALSGCTATTAGGRAGARSEDNLRDRCDRVPRQPIGLHAEQVNYGRYFVTNQTKEAIRLQAGGVTLRTSEIPPGATAAIFDAAEGSGGHVWPSNFFSSFSVESSHGTVYSGVNDRDWVDRGGYCGRARYELVVR